jgi:hypothetical protein
VEAHKEGLTAAALEPFEHRVQCPKCGGWAHDVRFCRHVYHHGYALLVEPAVGDGPEHLDVECQACGHCRYMRPMDATA